MMGEEVKIQGEQLVEILEDVEEARDNARRAENEIDDASRDTRAQMRKILIISVGIFLVVAVIVTIIILIIMGKK
jgi:t-SNARE complex subunit (syntaxin)